MVLREPLGADIGLASENQSAARTKRTHIMNSVLTMCLLLCLGRAQGTADDRPCVVIVRGAPGAAEYKPQFERWAGLWQAAAVKSGAVSIPIGGDEQSGVSDRERLHSVLQE